MRRAIEVNRRYFRQAYRTGIHGWETDDPSPYAVSFLRQLASEIPGAALLDLGCGEGRHACAAAKLGFRVTGVDAEPLAVAHAAVRARAAGCARIRFRRAAALKLPFVPAVFDIVLDYGCLHHQRKSDWRPYRDAVLRVLRPDGFYLLSAFTPAFRLFAGRTVPWHIADGAYRRCFTRADLHAFANDRFEFLDVREQVPPGFWHVLMKRI